MECATWLVTGDRATGGNRLRRYSQVSVRQRAVWIELAANRSGRAVGPFEAVLPIAWGKRALRIGSQQGGRPAGTHNRTTKKKVLTSDKGKEYSQCNSKRAGGGAVLTTARRQKYSQMMRKKSTWNVTRKGRGGGSVLIIKCWRENNNGRTSKPSTLRMGGAEGG